MPALAPAYCSTRSGASTFLLRIILGFIFAACFFSGTYAAVPEDLEARYKLYFAYLWGVAMVVSSIVGFLVEVLTLHGLRYTRLGHPLYLARIKVSHLLGLAIAVMVWFAISSGDEAALVARTERSNNPFKKYDILGDDGLPRFRTSKDPPWYLEKDYKTKYMDNTPSFLLANLIVNSFVILAMVSSGGISALILEAKAMRKTLSVANMIGLEKERDGVAEKRS